MSIHHYLANSPEATFTFIAGPLVRDILCKPGGKRMLRVRSKYLTASTPEQTEARMVESTKAEQGGHRGREWVEARAMDAPAPYHWPQRPSAFIRALILCENLGTWRQSLLHDYFDPIVWNRRNGMLVSGHLRAKVLTEMGFAWADVVVVDYSEKVHLARLVSANRQVGEDDSKLLGALLGELNGGTAITGIAADELAALVDGGGEAMPADATGLTPDRLKQIQRAWKTRAGQLWELGDHRLLCGDSTKAKDVDRACGKARAAVCVTDPPYSVEYEQSHKTRGGNKEVHGAYMEADLDPTVLLSFMKHVPSDLLIFSYPIDRHFQVLAKMLEVCKWTVRKELVWVKSNFAFWPGAAYQQQHEPIVLCTRGSRGFRDNVAADESTVIHLNKPAAHDLHPTARPVELWCKLIRNHSNPGDFVFEPFSGSGTAIMACEAFGRRCRAIELSPTFVAVALERWAEHTGRTPKLL